MNVKKMIVWLLIVLQIISAQSFVVDGLQEKVMTSDTLSDEITVVRKRKSFSYVSGRKTFDVEYKKNKKEEIFVEKVIVDDYGNEKKVFVRQELNVVDTSVTQNKKVTVNYKVEPYPLFDPSVKFSRRKENLIITAAIVGTLSAILVPALIYKHRNLDKAIYGY